MASNYVENNYSTIERRGRYLWVKVSGLSMGDKRDLDRLEKTIQRLQSILTWQRAIYRSRKDMRLQAKMKKARTPRRVQSRAPSSS